MSQLAVTLPRFFHGLPHSSVFIINIPLLILQSAQDLQQPSARREQNTVRKTEWEIPPCSGTMRTLVILTLLAVLVMAATCYGRWPLLLGRTKTSNLQTFMGLFRCLLFNFVSSLPLPWSLACFPALVSDPPSPDPELLLPVIGICSPGCFNSFLSVPAQLTDCSSFCPFVVWTMIGVLILNYSLLIGRVPFFLLWYHPIFPVRYTVPYWWN